MILITGATGFIGSHLMARLLLDGVDVLGVSRYDPRDETLFLLKDHPHPSFIRFDRDDPEAIGSLLAEYAPEVVIHLDANVNPPGLEKDPQKALRENFLHSFDWMNSASASGVQRFVFASSIGVLPRVQYEPIDASHPLVLDSEGPGSGFYGASKAAVEIFGLTFAKSTSMSFSAVRCSAVYGFGMQWPIGIKPALEGIASGTKVSLPRYGPPRDYTPVEHVVDILAAAAIRQRETLGILYAATGRPLVSVGDLNETLTSTFPESEIEITEENTDPQGIESLYRGVIAMDPTLTALGISKCQTSLADALRVNVEAYRDFYQWRSN